MIERARAPLAGHWTFPGGRVEPGETLETAVRREIVEELSLILTRIRPVGLAPREATGGHFDLTVFVADLADRAITPDPTEIARFGWFDPHGALPSPTTPGFGTVLDAIFRLRS